MKKSKRILIVMVILVLLFSLLPVFAENFTKKIEVLFNFMEVYVNGRKVEVDNILYDGRTYVPLRSVSSMLGMTVEWPKDSNKAEITETKNIAFNMKYTDGEYGITQINPKPLTDGNYLIWNYFSIQFDSSIKGIKDSTKVVLIDNKGDKVNVICNPGDDDKNALLITLSRNLELRTNYSLYIPKDSIIMENGDLYKEDILVYFKTAQNAVKGIITTPKNYIDKKIVLISSEAKEYKTVVMGDNKFLFTDIPAGTYKAMLDGVEYENIIIEDDKINNIEIRDIANSSK